MASDFCLLPLMRVHGYMTNTEFWNYGDKVTDMARKSLELRYRLLPYIYSEAAWVSLGMVRCYVL